MTYKLFEKYRYSLISTLIRYLILLFKIYNGINYLLVKKRLIYPPSDYFFYQILFFTRRDSYSLEQKPYISLFFSLFHKKIIKIIHTMLVIVIKEPKLYHKNKNYLLWKNIIWFKLYNQKNEISEYNLWVIFSFFNSIPILIIVLGSACLT